MKALILIGALIALLVSGFVLEQKGKEVVSNFQKQQAAAIERVLSQ